jgi:hypothetical protein
MGSLAILIAANIHSGAGGVASDSVATDSVPLLSSDQNGEVGREIGAMKCFQEKVFIVF